jgi:nitrogenase molybdenum-iron protein NifN
MATVVPSKKACATNPLKSSTPLGAALAYLGVEGAVPLFHGSQGCTSFALVLAVRHFKEAIPLQTTAMNEASTVLGGADHLEEAIINIATRMKPKLIGVASTALVETRGEDFVGELAMIRKRHPELGHLAIPFASTPDFEGALEDGWSKATLAVLRELLGARPLTRSGTRINVLPGLHQTPADLDELRDILEAFGFEPTFLPDVSTSLDGNVPDDYVGTSLGGTRLADVARMGEACHTIAIGEHMRPPAEHLSNELGVPYTLFRTLSGLGPSDELIAMLTELSGREVPARFVRQRSQLIDCMMDAHFWYGGRRIAIAADPDLLFSLSTLFASLGAVISTAIASTKHNPALADVPCDRVLVGDLGDFENEVRAHPADLLVTHSHGRMAADRLDIPLYRVGFPIFDRLGVQHRRSVGYRGSRELIYEVANMIMAEHHEPKPEDFGVDARRPHEKEAESHVHA